jgi:hypothetical protein
MPEWDLIDEIKKARPFLLEAITFENILLRLAKESEIICFDEKACKKEGFKDYIRPEFKLIVKPDLFDLFFNGLNGYRACYFHSSKNGIKS